jgi:hypothetical protein
MREAAGWDMFSVRAAAEIWPLLASSSVKRRCASLRRRAMRSADLDKVCPPGSQGRLMTYQKYHVDYRKDDLIDMYLHITLRLPGCDVSRSLCNNEKKRIAAG